MSRNTSLSMPRWHDEGFLWIAEVVTRLRDRFARPAHEPVIAHHHRRIEGEFADPRLRVELEQARRQIAMHNAGAWLW